MRVDVSNTVSQRGPEHILRPSFDDQYGALWLPVLTCVDRYVLYERC